MTTSQKNNAAMQARNAEIARRVTAGETLKSVGHSFDMTRERVRQICNNLGVISVRTGFEKRADYAGDLSRFHAAIRAGVPKTLAAKFTNASYQTLITRGVPPALEPLLVQNRRVYDREGFLRLARHEVFELGGTIASTARKVGCSKNAMRNYTMNDAALRRQSKINMRHDNALYMQDRIHGTYAPSRY